MISSLGKLNGFWVEAMFLSYPIGDEVCFANRVGETVVALLGAAKSLSSNFWVPLEGVRKLIDNLM